MNCTQFNTKIIPYLDHELTEPIEIEFEAHLDKCTECKILFNQIRSSYALIDSEREFIVSNSFAESVLTKIQTQESTKVVHLFSRIMKPLAVAASISLGIIIGNGELAVLTDNDDIVIEVSDVVLPGAPSEYSIWTTMIAENGN